MFVFVLLPYLWYSFMFAVLSQMVVNIRQICHMLFHKMFSLKSLLDANSGVVCSLNTDFVCWLSFDIHTFKYNFLPWKCHCLCYYDTHYSASWLHMSVTRRNIMHREICEVFEILRCQILSEYLPNPLRYKWETFWVFLEFLISCVLKHIEESMDTKDTKMKRYNLYYKQTVQEKVMTIIFQS